MLTKLDKASNVYTTVKEAFVCAVSDDCPHTREEICRALKVLQFETPVDYAVLMGSNVLTALFQVKYKDGHHLTFEIGLDEISLQGEEGD